MTYQPPAGPPAQDPGRTLGIVGLILAIFCNLIGLIISIIAYTKSKMPVTRTTSRWPESSSVLPCS